MSFLSSIENGLTKAENFLVSVLTKTKAVEDTLVSLAPATQAAILATFYDVAKTISSAESVVATAASGNIPGAFVLSAQTLALVKGVVADAETDGSVAKTDLAALGIALKTQAPLA